MSATGMERIPPLEEPEVPQHSDGEVVVDDEEPFSPLLPSHHHHHHHHHQQQQQQQQRQQQEEEDNGDAASHHSPQHQQPTDKDVVIPPCGVCCGRQQSHRPLIVNYNVLLNLIVCALYGMSDSLWNGTAYAAYVKIVGNNQNAPLGILEALNGMASLVTALPIGYLADKVGRSKVICAGGILRLLTIGLQIALLEYIGTSTDGENSSKFNDLSVLILMGVIMACWGVADGIVDGPMQALYADSTPAGDRSTYYTYLFACETGASAIGPVVAIILFESLGNEWDLLHLRTVIYVGLSIGVIYSIIMLFFDDRKALETLSNDESDIVYTEDELCLDGEAPISSHGTMTNRTLTPLQRRRQWIPYIVLAQGLILAIGSGMTVKFFPLFFKDEVGMSPSQVQLIYVSTPITMVILSALIMKLAKSGFGRVQATLLFSTLGVLLLFSMVFCKSFLDKHPAILVPIYILRTGLMNCSYPLQESILMDFVPTSQRARWKSLDSVAAFGWCGSAALGGWLSDRFDYTYTFGITAIIQAIGTAVFALLIPLVPRHEGQEDEEEVDAHAQEVVIDPSSLNLLQEPLLSS